MINGKSTDTPYEYPYAPRTKVFLKTKELDCPIWQSVTEA